MTNTNQTKVSKLKEILEGFDEAILMTNQEGEKARLRGRPMRIAELMDDTTLWFFTAVDSTKVREALADEEGYVVMQKGAKQAVLRGTFSISTNREKIVELWKKPLEIWFPKGPADPNVCLMRFTPAEAEFWDSSGLLGVKYFWENAKAFVMGTTPRVVDKNQHAEIKLSQR